MMQVISLFSGIGGFEIAAEWMGWTNIASCEINPFGQQVLKYYWPNAYHHDDVRTLDYEKIKERINPLEPTILVAGFPCQPFSQAGKRKGKEDDRYGWPDCVRAIREIQPQWCVFENVRGLTNWNGGMVFNEVQADLEAAGFEVLPFLLPACAVNAPHRRDRIWFVAHSNSFRNDRMYRTEGSNNERQQPKDSEQTRDGWTGEIERHGAGGTTPHPEGSSGQGEHIERQGQGEFRGCDSENDVTDPDSRRQPGKEHGKEESGQFAEKGVPGNWDNFPTVSPICQRNDEFSSRLVGITFPKWRNESIKALGNAIVPAVALQIFKAIEQYEK